MVRKGNRKVRLEELMHNQQEARETMLNPLFVAAVLEGSKARSAKSSRRSNAPN
jgi:hypothetical protein